MTLHRAIPLARAGLRALRRTRRAVVPAALALAALSCDDFEVAASLGTSNGAIGVGGQTASALIGRWLHADGGAVGGYTTETSWLFEEGGVATRTIVTRTALGEVVGVSETRVGWRAGVGVLLLDLGPPSFGVLRVPYSISYGVNGTVLLLDGISYLRLDP